MKSKALLPPSYFFMCGILAIALHFVVPVASWVPVSVRWIGAIPIVFGAVLNLWADQLFKQRLTAVKPEEVPTQLVREWPFSWFRHPMYIGMVMILFGISLLCGSVGSLVGPALLWVIMRVRFIPMEEKSLQDTFGAAYEEYARKVKAWM